MDFSSIFNGEALTMEQFAEKTKGMKLADLSTGAYVAKGKYDEDLKSAQSALEEAKKTVAALETNANDAEALQAELEKYKAAEAKRAEEAKAAAAREALLNRFNAVKGDKQFVSDFTEQGVLSSFEKAINAPENLGKGDAELFNALTKGKEGVFASAHPPVNMGGFGDAGVTGASKIPTFF